VFLFLVFISFLVAFSPVSASPSDPVIVAAGDISCSSCQQAKTAELILNINPDAVLVLGDSQYPTASFPDYQKYYLPTWGKFLPLTRPTLGNHEYLTPNASGYFDFFAHPKPFYSYLVGSWHIIALNSERDLATQTAWLKLDLQAHPSQCILAYWHQPRYSSGVQHGSNPVFDSWWAELANNQADIVLSGHEHNYERFSQISGIRQFVVGTGGAHLYPFGSPLPTSQYRDSTHHGVLKLVLHSTSYDWQFISTDNQVLDSGSTPCTSVISTPTPTPTHLTMWQFILNLIHQLSLFFRT
jgi:hypothetical protein